MTWILQCFTMCDAYRSFTCESRRNNLFQREKKDMHVYCDGLMCHDYGKSSNMVYILSTTYILVPK